jgi:undecaprenyl diphosphate synthase
VKSVSNALPKHVAIIMDGNGRWAAARGLPRIKGHEAGAESVSEIVRDCRERGIGALTLYSFSTENWKRPSAEVGALMGLLERYLAAEKREILDNGIRLNAIGQIDRLPAHVRLPLQLLMKDSSRNSAMTLTLALSYGGRREIVDAVQAIAKKVRRRELVPEEIDESTIAAHLYTGTLPDPDLLIRTSGEMRISNFLLWQLAYTEIYVTDVLWPDFRRPQLQEALDAYAKRERRYGLTGAQATGARR